MLAAVDVTTAVVLTEKIAVVVPPVTVTLGGTVPAALSLESATTAPDGGAGPVKVTEPTETVPPITASGFKLKFESTAGLMVSPVAIVPPKFAEIVTEVMAPTPTVETAKFAVVAPAATVALAGTVAAPLLLDSVTTAPPAGAGPFKVTVTVGEDPPSTLAGATDTEESTGGLIVRLAVCGPL
jgi:hypothetical protein